LAHWHSNDTQNTQTTSFLWILHGIHHNRCKQFS
jgi:hypothetical protein